MDIGKVFVLALSVFVIAILAYLEIRSRRLRQESQSFAPETEPDMKKVSRKD
jgi:hypothetical protein